MQAQQRQADARQLAETVATLSLAQGESFEDVAKDLHFNLADLAKDLGLSADQLQDYLHNQQDQINAVPDAVTANTDRLIDAIYDVAGLTPPDMAGGVNTTGTAAMRVRRRRVQERRRRRAVIPRSPRAARSRRATPSRR